MTWLASALILGLGSNFHCLGMCGPIALAVPVNTKNNWTRLLSILLYNSGRILVYAIIGALFGVFGSGLYLMGIQQQLSVAVGVLIVISALLTLLNRKTHFLQKMIKGKTLRLQQSMGKYLRKKGYSNNFVLGLLNGLLPCGLVYVALLGALATGSVVSGISFMVVFGLGTLPIMILLPWVKDSFSSVLRLRMQKAVPIFLMVFGSLLIVRGANLGIPFLSPYSVKPQVETTADGEQKVAPIQVPSCH